MNEALADRIDDAADYIEKHGWCQGAAADRLGRVCVVGALKLTSRMVEPDWNALSAIGKQAGVASYLIVRWNDTPGRTQQEVLDLLRAAAKDERRAVSA